MSGKYNIVADQGATFNLNFTVATDGTSWNLTGYTFKMQVRRSSNDANILLNITSATMNSSGSVAVTVSTTMNTVPPGRWVYDIELTSSGGQVTRILEGRFIVKAQVTQ